MNLHLAVVGMTACGLSFSLSFVFHFLSLVHYFVISLYKKRMKFAVCLCKVFVISCDVTTDDIAGPLQSKQHVDFRETRHGSRQNH